VIEKEVKRKIIHILVGCFAFAYLFLDRILIVLLCILLIILTIISKRYKRIYFFIIRVEEEKKGALFGVLYYTTSMLILSTFFDYRLAGAGVLALAWGDGFATILGRRYGKYKITSESTLVGCFSMFAFSFFGTAVALSIIPPVPGLINAPFFLSRSKILIASIGVSLFSTIFESTSRHVNDNITVPIMHAVLLALATNMMKI